VTNNQKRIISKRKNVKGFCPISRQIDVRFPGFAASARKIILGFSILSETLHIYFGFPGLSTTSAKENQDI